MKSTKELARELGILRKRTLTKSSAVEGDRKRAKKSNQIFSFLIVIDFESTCWQGERHRTQEIIEFPAVLLNTETGQIESEFHRYVQPQENPILSDFCKQLTGITQDQVNEAIPLFICLRQFSTWLAEVITSKMLTFGATDGASKPAAFVTWSDWDLGVCLQYECRRKQLRKPVELSSWIDLRATYRRYYQRKPQGLNGALQELGIGFEGREHSGLDDARNTAYLAWKMICDGCIMEITKTQTDAISVRTLPQFLQKPPSNPTMKEVKRNAKTPERKKLTDLQRYCENAKSNIGTTRQSPESTRVGVEPTHRVNVTRRQKNTRVEVEPTNRVNATLRQSPKNTRVEVEPTCGVNRTPRQSPKNTRVGVEPTHKVNGTPRQSPKNTRGGVESTHRVNITPRQKNTRVEVEPTHTPRHSPRNIRVEVQRTRSVNVTPRQSPKNTRVEVEHTHGVSDNFSDWGFDEIEDEDILQYLATASPSFRNTAATMQCASGMSYVQKFAGMPLKVCTRMQGQAVRTPTSSKKQAVFRDITNSSSCVLMTNANSEKILSHSSFAISSSNSMVSKKCSSPSSNCRKALHQDFTKIKSPTAKSTLTEKPLSSSSHIMAPSSSIPKNHSMLVKQLPDILKLPTSSVLSLPKPLSKSLPSRAIGLGRICSANGAHVATRSNVKSPGKILIQPPMNISPDSVALNGRVGGEQMLNPVIIKDVQSGCLIGKVSGHARDITCSTVTLQTPQPAKNVDTSSVMNMPKPLAFPGSYTPSSVNLQKPPTTSRDSSSISINLQKPQAFPGGNTPSSVNLQKPPTISRDSTSNCVNLHKPYTPPGGNTPNSINLQKPQTTPRINTPNNVNLQKLPTTTPKGINSVRPLPREIQVSATKEPSVGSLKSAATPSSTFFRTPTFASGSSVPSSSMRKTPPMCDCGCRAKRKFVQSPGPNLGKSFFSCGSQRSRSGSGCKFFRWEASSESSPLLSSYRPTPDGCKTRSFMSISPMVQPQFNTPSVLTRPRFNTSVLTRPR